MKSILFIYCIPFFLFGCSTPSSKVLPPYKLSNGDTYQDVVTVGSDGKGLSPTVTGVKTFHIRPNKKSELVSHAVGSESSIANALISSSSSTLSSTLPILLLNNRNRSKKDYNNIVNSYNSGSGNSGDYSGNGNNN